MINFDDDAGENLKQHNPNWPQTRILTTGSSGSGSHQSDNDNYIYMLKIHM